MKFKVGDYVKWLDLNFPTYGIVEHITTDQWIIVRSFNGDSERFEVTSWVPHDDLQHQTHQEKLFFVGNHLE